MYAELRSLFGLRLIVCQRHAREAIKKHFIQRGVDWVAAEADWARVRDARVLDDMNEAFNAFCGNFPNFRDYITST